MGDFEMMKKTTSALAVAALLGTGAASAATFQINDGTSLTVGGDIQYAYYDVTDGNGDSSTDFTDNGSSLVFAGEQTHDNGVTTSFYLDFDGFGDLGDDNDTFVNDEYHVAFAGDFGEIKVGNEGDVTGPVFDVVDVAEGTGLTLPSGGASSEVVQYYSNDLNGFSFAVQSQVNGDDQQGDDGSSTSFGGIITVDLSGITLGVGYDQLANSTDEATYGVMAATSIAGVDLSANFVEEEDKTLEDLDGEPVVDAEFIGIAANYGYGAGNLYGALNFGSADNINDVDGNNEDVTQYLVGVNYNVTPNAYVYGEVSSQDFEDDENDTTLVGLVYSW
jgi:hypothetical protein